MTDGLKDAHRTAIVNLLRANKRVERAVLFGSRAKQTFTPGSDVDIALFGKALTITDQAHLAAAMEELTIPQRVDLLLYHSIEDATLCEHVLQDGIELYRRQESAFDRPLNISEKYCQVLVSLLQKHLPGVEVWVYSSRVDSSSHDDSDLDLVLRGPELKEIPAGQLGDFQEALRESTIPFLVETRDWVRLSERFHQEIERDHLVLVRGDMDCAKFRPLLHAEPVVLHSKSDEEVGLLFGNCASLLSESVDPTSLSQSIPYIGLEHIIPEKLHLNGTGESTDVTSTKRRFERGNILFGKLRPYFRKVVQPDFDGICSTDIWIIEPKENVDSRFLFYWCASWDFVNFLDASSEGTRMPRAKWEVAVNHRIPSFSTHEQKAIAHILGTLDNKIELNKKMNQTLEEIAKTIFKSWFVDFDPVRAKAERRPTGLSPEISDLFPGELVDSEIGEVPKGWEVINLGQLLFEIGLKTKPSKETLVKPYVPIDCIARKSLALYEAKDGAEAKSSLVSFKKGDFLFGAMRPYFHKVCIAPFDGTTRTTCLVLNSKQPEYYAFSLFLLYADSTIEFATQNSIGSTIPYIKWKKELETLQLIKPSKLVANVFGDIVSPMLQKFKLAINERDALIKLRDTLLPKLISGELRIPDPEKFLKEANI